MELPEWWRSAWSTGVWLVPAAIGLFMLVAIVLCMRFCCGGRWPCRWPTDRSDSGAPDSPLDIAKRRYAAGEIGKDEFQEIKKTIS